MTGISDMRIAETREAVHAFMQGREKYPGVFLGEGAFSQVFDIGGDLVLKISGPYNWASNAADVTVLDGWQAYAPYIQQNPDPRCLPVLHFEKLQDNFAWGIVPMAREVAASGEHSQGLSPRQLEVLRIVDEWSWHRIREYHYRRPWVQKVWALYNELRGLGAEVEVDLHSGNFLLYNGKLVISDPFGGSSSGGSSSWRTTSCWSS